MKMLAEISIELEASARQMELADILTWIGTGLMIHQEEDAILEPQSGPVEFQGKLVGSFAVSVFPAKSANSRALPAASGSR